MLSVFLSQIWFKFSSHAAVCVVEDTGDLTEDRIQAIRLPSKCSASLATWPPASVFPFPLQMQVLLVFWHLIIAFHKKKSNCEDKVCTVDHLGVFVTLVVIWVFISHSSVGLLEKNRGWCLLQLHACFPQPCSYTLDYKTQWQPCSCAQSHCSFPALHEPGGCPQWKTSR